MLSFGAHLDDIEIGCAGLGYQLIQKSYEVTHVYVTSGEAGSQVIPKAELAAMREVEALKSAEFLGVKRVEFLRCADRFMYFTQDTRA